MIEKLVLALAAGLAAAELSKSQQKSIMQPVIDEFGGFGIADFNGFGLDYSGLLSLGGSIASSEPLQSATVAATWLPPSSAQPYLSMLYDAEIKHGLPENLLVRVAYQESRFRQDIITGAIQSGAGALGIMQIVPRWHPDIDPLNVPEAIDYAAGYLAKLRRMTGSWQMALAAYNWGIGNLKNIGFENAPRETINYVAEISHDVAGVYA